LVNQLIFANLGHRPLRTFLSVLLIGVNVTMILCLVGVSYGTLDASANRARGIGADIFVRPPGTSAMGLSSAPMSEKTVGVLAKLPGVDISTGTIVQSLGGFDSIQGVDFPVVNAMSGGFKFLAGGPPVQPDDIIVDQFYARQKKLQVGDTLKLASHDWHLAGIYEAGKLARVISRKDTLQQITGSEGKISAVYLKLKNPAQTDAFAAQLRKELPGYQIYTLEEFTSQLTVSSVPLIQGFIDVVIFISAFVGFLVTSIAMYTAVLERTREIGILKAVGAGPAYILNILLRESILLALFSTVAGIVMSYGTRALMVHAPSGLTQEIIYKWWLFAALIAVAGALLGTIYPAAIAIRHDAVEALSYE
jgi:putative ABC transport system permease protein